MNTGHKFEWLPNADGMADSILSQFIERTGEQDLEALSSRAERDPGWLVQEVLAFCDFRFYKPYERILDTSQGVEWANWCVGGTTNIVLNCLDRHKGTPVWEQPFLLWEAEDPQVRRTLTYREFDAEVCRLAAALRELNVVQGDRVALFMPNLPETMVAFFAVLKLGAVVLPLFSGFGPQPIADRLAHAEVKAVLTVDGARRRGKIESMKQVLDEALRAAPSVKSVVVLRSIGRAAACAMMPGRDHDWQTLVGNRSPELTTAEMEAEAPAVLYYTSGTTGKPKGCVWTHVGFLGSMITRDMHICADFRRSDRFFFMSDMGWMVGAMCACLPSYFGASVLIAEGAPDYPDRGRFWRLVQDHRVTYLGVAPTLIRGLMRDDDVKVGDYDLSSLRVTLSAGEAWTDAPWHWFFKHVCRETLPFLNIVGGTEVGGCNLIGTLHHPLRPGSFGMPGLGAGLSIVDGAGEPVGVGQIGDLVLANPNIGMTKGLWRDKEKYLDSYWRTLPGRWVHGDLAIRDEAGLYYVLGRSDDVIKVSGKRTGPSEIETLLIATGKLSEAAVIGVPDDIKGSAIACVCVPMPGVTAGADLEKILSEAVVKSMGGSFRPALVLLVDDLPKTRNMKIMRRVIRSLVCSEDPGDLSSLANPEAVIRIRKALEIRRTQP